MDYSLKKCLAVALSFMGALCVCAGDFVDNPKVSVAFAVRADFVYERPNDDQEPTSGIYGKFLNLMLNGTINDQLSYSWKQRMNRFNQVGDDAFAATDWVYLRYQPTDHWAFSAGKEIVLIGGFEYDAPPIDVYFASRYWNNIQPYQFGATATYIINSGQHELSFQICNSPYFPKASSCYVYSLFWKGSMGCYSTLWSVNMVEYERDKYVNYIALGNRINIDAIDIQLDFMNRATPHNHFIAGDFSVIGKVKYAVRPWLTLYAKAGYDQFKSWPGGESHVDNPFFGGGMEFFPIKASKDLRLHMICDRISDNVGVHYFQFNVGLTWRMSLYNNY